MADVFTGDVEMRIIEALPCLTSTIHPVMSDTLALFANELYTFSILIENTGSVDVPTSCLNVQLSDNWTISQRLNLRNTQNQEEALAISEELEENPILSFDEAFRQTPVLACGHSTTIVIYCRARLGCSDLEVNLTYRGAEGQYTRSIKHPIRIRVYPAVSLVSCEILPLPALENTPQQKFMALASLLFQNDAATDAEIYLTPPNHPSYSKSPAMVVHHIKARSLLTVPVITPRVFLPEAYSPIPCATHIRRKTEELSPSMTEGFWYKRYLKKQLQIYWRMVRHISCTLAVNLTICRPDS